MKYLKFVRENFNDSKFPVFKLSELRTSLGLRGISDSYLKRMVNYLSGRNEIKRVIKGVYTFHDDISVVGFAFKPFYYGLENALTIRKLWEQSTNPVVITTKNVRTGIRKFGDGNYNVERLDRKLFFGYELVKYYDFWIPVSDYEKTLIDFVYFNHEIRKDVLVMIKRSLNRDRLNNYLGLYRQEVRINLEKLIR
jgi:predicted transcriptional regulator of viral defense system